MPDYKENKLIEIENYLEQTILQDVANPNSVLNRPDFAVATISRIMSNYIRTLRNVATRQWSFEVLNLFEFASPLFTDFYECVIANELGYKRENIDFYMLYKTNTITYDEILKFRPRGKLLEVFPNFEGNPEFVNNPVNDVEDEDDNESSLSNPNYYIESPFIKLVRNLSYYFQRPDKIEVDFLLRIEKEIDLSMIFKNWMQASDNPSFYNIPEIKFKKEKLTIWSPNNMGIGEPNKPIQYLKERLRDGTFNYKKDILPSTAIGRTPI